MLWPSGFLEGAKARKVLCSFTFSLFIRLIFLWSKFEENERPPPHAWANVLIQVMFEGHKRQPTT